MSPRRCLPMLLAALALAAQETATSPPAIQAYRLGPEDTVIVRAMELEEIPATPLRVDPQGMLEVPLAGRVQAAGRTPVELANDLSVKLGKYVREPHVSVSVAEYHSRPISILGAVTQPGVHQLAGQRPLLEVLALAGGLRPEAGSRILLTRQLSQGALPLPNAHEDETHQFSVASVDLDAITNARRPGDNILMQAHDVISVPRAPLIYVLGEVRKPGGFTLHERESLSLLQALALAEGMQRTASPKKARLLRSAEPGEKRKEVAINLDRILEGKTGDVTLQPDDILFIPNNAPRTVALRAAETALQIGTGVLVFRR